MPRSKPGAAAGKHVAILGLGPSVYRFMDLARRVGGRKRLADEVWAINSLGDVFACDRVFHMDDVRIQQVRADATPDSNIAVMLDWMKAHPGPIYTSRLHPDYPGLVRFPLQDVLNDLKDPYFNGTAAYAAALAIHERVATISFWGCDYTYANAHHAEQGRACLEFWIGQARARGIGVEVNEMSSLMDSCEGMPLYGYGAMGSQDVRIRQTKDGRYRVTYHDRPSLPTAEEIAAAYDHTKHPSPLVRGKTPS